MTRTIITPAVPPGSALAELKQWLGITINADDAPLRALLASALETAESFTGSMLLEQTCEERLPSHACWQALGTRPVQAIVAVDQVDGDGTRTLLDADRYEIDLRADGTGALRIRFPRAGRIAVRFVAGLAPEWDGLPEALRHGVVRLAAHQHREREGSGAAPLPPASVVALWRPWRRLRLA
ncbi:putative phiE125 gp8 family phage protein [Novosphingobium chloroacetimidivorans]|uniref:Putative phiE125 gp8 family phage protein n=1 Tax=Novosphingobium chloroacetimidivorans TaxID=1428314 RepID=A0A7W7KC11_9SPHN|nr:phage head-tail connector protein [Novosphingobium chloroacetimidivorans]MBB4860052.1 putative phiE125 gp8 family phage protein [Novosphingobium chloroacetimidivorans]